MRSGPWRGTQLHSSNGAEHRRGEGAQFGFRRVALVARLDVFPQGIQSEAGVLHQGGARGMCTTGLCNLQRLLDVPREASQDCRFSRCQSGARQKAGRRAKQPRATG